MDLRTDGLSVEVGGTPIVRDLNLEVPDGRIVGLVGPNGSGKSTVLRCVYRALRPSQGTIWVGGEDLSTVGLRASAQRVAALTQEGGSDLDFTVAEVVALGRSPHRRGNHPLDARERALCQECMELLEVEHLAHRGILELSGGERQRVLVARALVQEPRLLVLDEPTNHLDLRHQIRLLSLLGRTGVTVLVVLHDLNLAATVCDHIGVLAEGRLVTAGAPTDVITPDLVRDVFGVEAVVLPHPLTGVPQLLYRLDSEKD